MKRILFYLLIVIQLIVIFTLIYQFEKIDETGNEIKLQTIKPEYPIYDVQFADHMYVEYEINKVPIEKWNKSDVVDHNNRVYVLLKRDESGIFQVETVSADTLLANSEDEIVLNGIYRYTDEHLKHHYINYGFEEIKHVSQYGEFNGRESLIVTVRIGKWGQQKITAVEKTED